MLLLAACSQHRDDSIQLARPLPAAAPVTAPVQEVTSKGTIPTTASAVKVALLLPLSGNASTVGNAMLDAATMALSDAYLTASPDQIHSQIILIPKDTSNTPAEAAKAAQQAIEQGATFIVGPLFSQSVNSVAPIAKEHNVSMLTFSNNKSAAKEGIYTFGFLPEQQIMRMSEYAYLHNFQRVALLAPNDSYGEKVKESLVTDYTQKGGLVTQVELYAPSPANIDAAVARLSVAYGNTPEDRRFQAIFIADGGNQLRNIIAGMRKMHIDFNKVKLLGTGLWDDAGITKIPELTGAWFPSSPPDPYEVFENRFVATYGYKPVRLASLSYDAMTLIARLEMPTQGTGVTNATLTNPVGFTTPANGLVRLMPDGTSDRKLAIMEVMPTGFKVIDPALQNF
jgi:ABC-type branched-subunit amino acid transport system substrate-binding protein